MSFTYTRDIPDPPSSPSVDVPNMKVNTNSIDSIWAVDHQTFSGNNAGTHLKVSLTETSLTATPQVLPTGILGGGFETLYSQPAGVAPLGPLGEIFYSRAGGVGIQLTGPGTPTKSPNGYTFLAGGLVLQWGIVNALVVGDNPVAFLATFGTAIYNVTLSPVNASANVVTTIKPLSVTTAGFTAVLSAGAGATGLFWTAIGY